MAYLVMIHATFDSKADADHIYNQAKSVAVNSSVARIGEAGERTSHGGVYVEQADGTLVPDRRFHIDRFGIVRSGQMVPDDVIPDHIASTGAHDAYPANDVFGNQTQVRLNNKIWANTHGDGNVWTPGVFGWSEVPQ